MASADLLRLAWQAARDARPGLRDALLTLALAESGPADRPWAERCWRRLIASRSDDLIAAFPSWELARRDERVAARVTKLRLMFPPSRVQRLLMRGEVLRGTYTGRRSSMAMLIDDLLSGVDISAPRVAAAQPSPRVTLMPKERSQAGPADRRSHTATSRTHGSREGHSAGLSRESHESEKSVYLFYLTVLLALAMFLASTEEVSGRDSKAA